jgi:GntR family transcriptional regulator, transcriptional repressor for pyruvate dehydrogenase complex
MTGTSQPPADNLADRVISHLIEHIRRNKLTWGTQVPSEVRLSSELRVSRGIVREAYRALKAAGILEITNGRSPRVGRLDNRPFIQFLQHALSTAQASQEQVFDVRSSIEVRAAELAAEKRTEEDAAALLKEVAAMRKAGRQRERFVRADLRFHEIIGRATGNPLFGLLGNALRTSLDLTIRAGYDSRHSSAELDRVVQIHEGLADAIVKGDRAKARRLMTVHFEEARDFVLRRAQSAPGTAKARKR